MATSCRSSAGSSSVPPVVAIVEAIARGLKTLLAIIAVMVVISLFVLALAVGIDLLFSAVLRSTP